MVGATALIMAQGVPLLNLFNLTYLDITAALAFDIA
jgi:hypothetical protein